ncbi:succinate--hydroxymethylglutarate CoA-transferase [Monomorium pharaonis]|uniref:succinate--hydroxymethylglutarate CoA-transferase n=1 Tax=Monomorium pharaonis TaxID=307658 RepID=UPI00063F9631|nr:succinate--hydroxymethylglutarate CoA-transferase [Monomorium pharaonis]XP_012533389.1 succinate--hydroxymethylglutarate CoA-transferase [Monomorium pharaonis]XP_036139393.1 succinate--hydroxymethylglutarate CoA-transferase [Monomorium pharaonis]
MIRRGILATCCMRSRAASERPLAWSRRREFCTAAIEPDDGRSPLNGIRVLDLTRIVAGPYCTMILGDLGAEVLKIERPDGGDEARNWGPPFCQGTREATYFMSVNRNKKSVCVDLKRGRDIIYELARTCDVLVENYVPGKLNSMGLGYEDVARIAPRLVYCSLTGYGSQGPYASRPGYDVIAASLGGLLHITGPKDGPPCKVGVAMTDLATGLYAHGAIMAALLQRMRTNKGQWIQCNLLSTQISCLINIASNYLNGNKEATRWGSEHESIVPYEAFSTKDGYMTIGIGSDAQFIELVKRLQMPELGTNDKFKNNTVRVKNRTELLAILRDTLKKKTNQDWSAILKGASFPYGAVNNIREVFDDPHVKYIKLVQEVDHPVAGKVKLVGPPVTYSYATNIVRSPPPALGQHTSEVLRNILNYSDDKVESLKAQKVVR